MPSTNRDRERADLDELLSDAKARIRLSVNRARELELTVAKLILKKLRAKVDDYRYCVGSRSSSDDIESFSPLARLHELYPQICIRFIVRPEIVNYAFPRNSASLFDSNTVLKSRLVAFYKNLVDEYENDDIAMIFVFNRNKMVIMNEACRAEEKIRAHNSKRCELVVYDSEDKYVIRRLDDIINAIVTEDIVDASDRFIEPTDNHKR